MSIDSVISETVERSGAHEVVRMRVRYTVNPAHEANAGIVDLDRAPADVNGSVAFEGDVWLQRPTAGADATRLVVVAANRGRAGWAPFGERFLADRGWATAWIGWQWDVTPGPGMVGLDAPQAVGDDGQPISGQVRVEILSDTLIADRVLSDPTGAFTPYAAADVHEAGAVLTQRRWIGDHRTVIDRRRWRFARDDNGRPVPDDEHVWLEGGLQPHIYYEVVYTTRICPIAGAGLLAFRDAGAFLRDRFGYEHVVAYGASQSGRFLRGWLHEGLNRDDAGRQVYDGALAEVAGGRRGECNQRYAQPALMYPAGFSTMRPFAIDEGAPKIVFTNAAWEYWLGDAALTHVDTTGTADLPDRDSVRHYFFAGIDHFGNMADLKNGLPVANRPNTTDAGLLRRAVFTNLEAWVCDGVEPPPSQVPRLADGTAVSRRHVLAALARLNLPELTLADPDALPAVWETDLGPGAAEGVGRWPAVLGEAFPDLVSAVDGDGNEVAGVRLPEVAVPVGTHTGWNVRQPTEGLPDTLYPRCGTWLPFATTEAERVRTSDPRPSLAERYRDRADYEQRVRAAAADLVRGRFLLEDDVEAAVGAALSTYDAAFVPGVMQQVLTE